MDNFEDPSNLIVGEELLKDARLMAEEKENNLNEETENELNEQNEGSNKRRRPSEDSNKEDLSECKKAKKSPSKIKPNKRGRPAGKDKKSPKKRVNLKIMSINKNGKKKNFTRLYKKNEICIFCREEYIRETPDEAAGQDKPDRIKICRSCRACLEDEVVINEIREIIKKRSIVESDEANKKVEYFCGMCRNKINMNFPTIVCIKCDKWVHKRCVSIPWEKAVKNKHGFKCKNCERVDKTPEEEYVPNVPNVMGVEELTNKILLSGECANGENSNLSNIDLKSLENGGWVTDSIIAHVFGKIQQYVNEDKLALVKPSITQIFRRSPDPCIVAKTVEDLKLKEKDYILFPVNNNDRVEGEGGSHWSLLVYISDKRDVNFYHYDPIRGANNRQANELVRKLSETDTFCKSKLKVEEVLVPNQINGHDCGIYTMLYAGLLAGDITNGIGPKPFNITPDEVNKCRERLRQKISAEMDSLEKEKEKEKKSNDKKQFINKKVNNTKRDDTKRDDICWKHINYRCYRGVDCPFKHPNLCESRVDGTPCGTGKERCNLYHPEICRNYRWYKVCKWGDRCKYRHIDNMKRHRIESDGPMFRRNYNINNEHINEYRRNGSHPNRYRGSYNTYNNYRYNEDNQDNYRYNEDNHRNLHHPRDKYNRNTHFFGHQKNPTDWPTPREAELLQTLRKFLQTGPNKWGPARG